ncbi:glucose-6-phosphate dehydrogenase [Candidatus Curtissbacteria bacterium]|nr:glucose-6-phosphate dehydrogenase [Candidatus Curtissbacteria bacterium]
MAQAGDIEKVKSLSAIFVIFGATGDLSRKKIFPSFFELTKANMLPKNFRILGAARSKLARKEFIDLVRESITTDDTTAWKKFESKVDYITADVAEDVNLDKVGKYIDNYENEIENCPQRVFYMAIANTIYEKAFENLGMHELNKGCKIHDCKARIVVEKPFGQNLETAIRLDEVLNKYFTEEQIYRIDHFLGKETVQNIFALRFANEIFEPIWNNHYIDHVQITAAEFGGIERRGAFYDQTGALRDFVQNHLLQLLTLVAMEVPEKFNRESIRKRKIEVLESLRPMDEEEIKTSTVRGQYEGYLTEDNVATSSKTETYALLKLFIENKRWQGVPFYIRTGKRLTGKVTSIILSFKEKTHKLFENFWEQPMPNHITIQIDPTEGIGIRLIAKKPGVGTQLEPVDMEFCYKTSFDIPNPNAYERLLLDIIAGDQTLFLGPIRASWKFIDPIRNVWDNGKPELAVYKQGSWGPEEANKLIKRDGREWLAPLLTICKI